MIEAVPVALKDVVQGDDNGIVGYGEGMLVLVGSARAIGTSIADRIRRASRIANLVAPGYVVGMFVVVSMACFGSGSERLVTTFSAKSRPAIGR